jgi:hypothetical protein
MWEEMELISNGSDSGSKKCKWCLLWGLAEFAFGRSLEPDGWFCVAEFGRDMTSVAVKMFSF